MWNNLRWSTNSGKVIWLGCAFLCVSLLYQIVVQVWNKEAEESLAMPMTGKMIIIDPGHGGFDGGAVSATGLVEKEVTLKIALFLRDYLQEAGALVVMTRETDTDLSQTSTKKISHRKAEDLMQRVKLIEDQNADVFISIHLNAIPSPRWSGAQTFYHPKREENKKLATLIQSQLIHHLGNTNRLAKQKGDVYILKASPVPTALVEVGFLSNPQEASLLGTEDYQKKLAASIYYGLLEYYTKD
ncbi:N-acetylmuramoyl-L-alanine amidase CwlD [Hazenella coriacea]|uniref:N-acetylmuramoyl-L-alanine amidase n=1 Tax=Hazenella coriacea TaxID=1179467 RepID=A0A4R3L390_9BACL|nr:N-acetylmuramoyl-L-alanine amidase CwlD [Hazenella coriacea]TCS94141.1 N-acetylmuramoyl-L-alanine amidase [Hazenella coriacea]